MWWLFKTHTSGTKAAAKKRVMNYKTAAKYLGRLKKARKYSSGANVLTKECDCKVAISDGSREFPSREIPGANPR